MDPTSYAAAIILVYFGMLFMSMVAHEYAHAWTATRAGDTTAYDMGRLTFNPLVHVDLFWTIVMPIAALVVGFPLLCGPKPIPTNPYSYNNLVRDYRIVSGAGLIVNLAIAALLATALHIMVARGVSRQSGAFTILSMVLLSNILLTLFNLLPIPPLDGSRLLRTWLPNRLSDLFDQADRFGLIILIVLIQIPGFSELVMNGLAFAWVYVFRLDIAMMADAYDGYIEARNLLATALGFE